MKTLLIALGLTAAAATLATPAHAVYLEDCLRGAPCPGFYAPVPAILWSVPAVLWSIALLWSAAAILWSAILRPRPQQGSFLAAPLHARYRVDRSHLGRNAKRG